MNSPATFTGMGLEKAYEVFQESSRFGSSSVRKALLVITDGVADDKSLLVRSHILGGSTTLFPMSIPWSINYCSLVAPSWVFSGFSVLHVHHHQE